MTITRAESQAETVYIENAYKDTLSNLQDAMAKYKRFTETGDIEDLKGIREMLDESLLALSDLAMAVDNELPEISNLSVERIEELTSDSDIPF